MEELRAKLESLNIEFIEHRARSEAGHKAIIDDVDELKADLKEVKGDISTRFQKVDERLSTIDNNISDLKINIAKQWSISIPKDPKVILFLIMFLASMGFLGPSSLAIADKATDILDIQSPIVSVEPQD